MNGDFGGRQVADRDAQRLGWGLVLFLLFCLLTSLVLWPEGCR